MYTRITLITAPKKHIRCYTNSRSLLIISPTFSPNYDCVKVTSAQGILVKTVLVASGMLRRTVVTLFSDSINRTGNHSAYTDNEKNVHGLQRDLVKL